MTKKKVDMVKLKA